VIPLEHHWLSYFENGHALVGGPGDYQTRKQGLIRSDGTIIAEPSYDEARRPNGDGLPRVRRDGTWYRVERNGELTPSLDDNEPDGSLIASCPQGLRIKKHGTGYLVEDADGQQSLPEPVGQVSFGILNDDGSVSGQELSSRKLDCRVPVTVSLGDYRRGSLRSTYVRPDGRPLFDPPQFFPMASSFYLGHAVVGTAQSSGSGDWGIIDTRGGFTFPLGPERVRSQGHVSKLVNAAIFAIGEGDGARLTDAQGRSVPEVERAVDQAHRRQALSCGGGARIVGDGERFGIAGPNGETLVPAIHRAISCYGSGVAWAPRDDRRSWCPIGVNGAFRDAPACLRAFYPMMVTHHYPERFSDDPHESSVLWVRARLRYGIGLRDKPPRWIGDGVMSLRSYSVAPFSP
jgi:hypothetical protein